MARGIVNPKTIEVGGSTVRLWTLADVEKGRKLKGTLRLGRPKKK